MDYQPVWYKAIATQDFRTPTGVVKSGQTVYFTPSCDTGATIMFDGKKAFRSLYGDESQQLLGIALDSAQWEKAPNAATLDQQYMTAVMNAPRRRR